MLVTYLFLCGYLFAPVISSQLLVLSGSITGSITGSSEATIPTGSYASYKSTITITTESVVLRSTVPVTTIITTSSQIILQGSVTTAVIGTASGTPTETSSSTQPINTGACNNYAEFCARKYSNITEVSAHNSPFVVLDNVASNQAWSVTTQLNDGIRQLQGQMHFVNDTPHFCHTTCDLLDVGPITDYLATVYSWVSTHPYDVVTILLENGDYRPVTDYVPFLESTGLVKYAYIPPQIPMALDDWPTLETMILAGKRVVFFMDYDANQTAVPWILDEFSQMWETPFDQTNRSFPCTTQRPPNLSDQEAEGRMYMTNHNLNYEIDLLGNAILVPYIPLLDVTNNVSGFGSLGQGVQDCYDMWNFPPKFLDVDYYNVGNGSVFEVAAKWNNVKYNRTCCGVATSGSKRVRGLDDARILAGISLVLTSWLVFC